MITQFDLIIAATENGAIGKEGGLPWRIPEDMAFFKAISLSNTSQSRYNAVIMGRVTYESIPESYRPLSDRINIVISSKLSLNPRLDDDRDEDNFSIDTPFVVRSFDNALSLCTNSLAKRLLNIYVIGGAHVYKTALEHPGLRSIFWTRVQRDYIDKKCDVFVKNLIDPTRFVPVAVTATRSYGRISYDFTEFTTKERAAGLQAANSQNAQSRKHCNKQAAAHRNAEVLNNENDPSSSLTHPSVGEIVSKFDNPVDRATLGEAEPVYAAPTVIERGHEEFQYLDLIASIITNGARMPNRTGVDTLVLLGKSMRFDLSRSFPLLTTKRVFWKGVVEELLWFIQANTNSTVLSEKGVKIWDANGSKAFLASRGFPDREEGDLGPVYGFQWRHFNATYKDMHTDYTGQGVDQLQNVIETIKSDPYGRRTIMTAWNPSMIEQMALPPCHMFCQFFVDSEDRLSCLMYQRSADVGLGVPFNIASYALLCAMIAQVTKKKLGSLIHVMGNCHVYVNHVEPLKVQIQRCPRPFPLLHIDPNVENIDDFRFEHFKLLNYNPMPKIHMEMAV